MWRDFPSSIKLKNNVTPWTTMQENLSLEFPTKSYPYWPAQLQWPASIVKFYLLQVLIWYFPNSEYKIRLPICNLSAPLLFANLFKQGHAEAHICLIFCIYRHSFFKKNWGIGILYQIWSVTLNVSFSLRFDWLMAPISMNKFLDLHRKSLYLS